MQRFISLSLVACLFAAVGFAQEAKPTEGPKITYDDHVRPIFREHCFACHAQDRTKGGLTLDTYAKTMAGGSSGEVVFAGDTGSSRLWHLITQAEEPKMPPEQPKIAQVKLDLVQKWIEQGALENSGSKAVIKKKKDVSLKPASIGKPEGPPPMPENLIRQPVVYLPKAGQTTALASAPWSPLVAVAGHKQILLYHSESGELLGVLPFPEGQAFVLRFSRNGQLLLAGGGRGGHSGSVVLFEVKTGKRVAKIGEELDAVLAADVSADHQLVALGGPSKVVRIYSVATGELLHEIKKHTDWVIGCEFSPDGVLLATSDRSAGLFVWESGTAGEYLSLRGHTGAIADVSWRSDGNVLASTGEDGTIRQWEMEEGKQLKQWPAHGGGGFCVEYTHDGRICSAGRDNLVKSWAVDGAAIKSYPAFTEQALACAFTFDGKKVIGGDWLGAIKAWDAAEAKEVLAYTPNPVTLEMSLAAAQQDAAAKQPAADQANKEFAEIQKLLADRTTVAKAAADKAAAAAAEPGKIDAAVNEAKKGVETLQLALKTAQDALTAAQEARKAVPDDKAEEKAAKDTAIAAAEQEVNKVQLMIAEQTKKAETIAATKPAAEEAAKVAAAEATQRENERKETEGQVAAKKAAADAANAAFAAANAVVQQRQADLAAFQGLAGKLAAEIEAAKQKSAPLKAAMDQAVAAQEPFAKAAAEKAAQMKEMAAKLEALKAELAKLEADKKAADDALAAKQTAVTQAQEALGDAEAAVEKAAAEQQAFQDAYGKK